MNTLNSNVTSNNSYEDAENRQISDKDIQMMVISVSIRVISLCVFVLSFSSLLLLQ